MRQGEILGLKWDCVDLENRMIYVQRAIKRSKNGYELKDLKNSSSYRSITMSERLMFELKKHKAKQIEQKMKYGKDYDD
jgi:integrase